MSLAGALCSDAVEGLVGAEEDLAVGNSGARLNLLAPAKVIAGQLLEGRLRRQDIGFAGVIGDVNLAVGGHHRAPARAAQALLAPKVGARLDVETLREPGLAEQVDVPADQDRRADALGILLGVMPEAMGLGDVAVAAGFDCQGRAVKARKSDDNA